MRFPSSFLDEIRERVPISSLVGTRVTFDLKKSNAARGDFWACCPFHREKTPSFHCDDGRGRYHCFGCGASGDVFRFLTELEGVSFYEAVEQLASQAGLAVPKVDETTKNQQDERERLHEILEKTALFFERALRQGDARQARDYLTHRGLDEAMIRHFRLGFAADHRSCLREYLGQQGYGLDLMAQAGLIISGEDVSVPYDRFRHRIMFPIADLKGRIVGFGGRALATNARAKYLNSPDTEMFHKGNLLYNLGAARQVLRTREQDENDRTKDAAKSLIVVEGYMDVIALASVGIVQAVAPLGTAMTHEQLQLLWRFSSSPIVCFDGDEAGFNAALRLLDRALPVLKTGLSLQFVLLPKAKDPDDIVRDGGAQAFTSLLRQALPLAEMLWRREILGKKFDTPESRATLEKTLMQAVFTITDENLRRYYLQDITHQLTAGLVPSSPLARYDAGNLSVTLRRGRSGHFEARALVNGSPLSFMLDTGASRVVLAHEDAVGIGLDVDNLNYSVTTSTANGLAQAAPVRLQSVDIGGIERHNVSALVMRPRAMSGSLLGMSFLNSLSGYTVRADQLTLVD